MTEVVHLLGVAVSGIGGQQREGQQQMTAVVDEALQTGRHAVVQAGTGTGKSIGYLVPVLAHLRRGNGPVVVATATLALQHQLVERDLPALDRALREAGEESFTWAVLKGRANYLCQQRLHDPEDVAEDGLFEVAPASRMEGEASRLRKWASETQTGDRDEAPEVDARVWRAFSVTSRECVGASKCAYGDTCFAEVARARAQQAQVIVTNHALLSLHALDNLPVLPEHDAVIIDEAHELPDRAVAAMTSELSPLALDRALTGMRREVSDEAIELVEQAGQALADSLFAAEGRLAELPAQLRAALGAVRDAAHAVISEMSTAGEREPDAVARRSRVRAAVEQVHDAAALALAADRDSVVWVERIGGRPPSLRIAPLSVSQALSSGLLAEHTVVFTSATLAIGGNYEHLAQRVGLQGPARVVDGSALGTPAAGSGDGNTGESDREQWTAADVGSPFDFGAQGILYVATDLPRPGRDGPSTEALDEMAELVQASGGRALVLYSSWRGVDAARERLADWATAPVLVQQRGDAVGPLVARFAEEPTSVLIGTMSLWQGVDVSGPACQLVIIDRIPFPRPDDPLVQARSQRAEDAGGSGFAAVSVPRAALMLAQGAGRLIRSQEDKGVVAVLDPRLVRSGYGARLRATMPPMWLTTDRTTVLSALQRLAVAQGTGAS